MRRVIQCKYAFGVWALVLLTTLFLCGCGSKQRNVDNHKTIMVSIEPLKYFVEEIVGNDFDISVIVPAGEGPETYSPTPSQAAKIEKAEFVFLTGLLNFEHELIGDNDRNNSDIYTISDGARLIYSAHSHSHHNSSDAEQNGHNHNHLASAAQSEIEQNGIPTEEISKNHDHEECENVYHEVDHNPNIGNLGEGHAVHVHGVDPHIWLSVRELKLVVDNITNVITAHFPDSTHYAERAQLLKKRLEVVDLQIAAAFAASGVQAFAIYHPALSYYARDYGLEQIAIEDEGKEPNLARLKMAVDRSKALGINKIFYQIEYPVSVVENFAHDLDAEPVAINPLSEDIVGELCRITTLLTGVEFEH